MCIVCLAGAEERLEGVVCWDREAKAVYEEAAGDVKKDEQGVYTAARPRTAPTLGTPDWRSKSLRRGYFDNYEMRMSKE